MQIANVRVSLGGDHGNTVPMDRVTAAEITVLRLIHGDEAVQEIEPVGEVPTNHAAERARLLRKYGKMVNGQEVMVSRLYPGVGSRVTEKLTDIVPSIPEEFYKAIRRVTPTKFDAEAQAERDYLASLKGETAPAPVQAVEQAPILPPYEPAEAPVATEATDAVQSALSHLDPAHDAHWTRDGLPATAAVSALAGRIVTRAEINEVAPGFIRPAVAPGIGPDNTPEPDTGIGEMTDVLS